MAPDLSIIVSSYKSPAILKICLKSILNSLKNKNINYELIVVDSATEEETRDMMEENFPDIKFIPHKENMGVPKVYNAGIRVSKGKYIAVFNGDMIFKEDSIEKMLSYIKQHPEIGFLGPVLLSLNESIQPSCYGSFYTPWIILCRRTFFGKTFFGKRSVNKFMMKEWDHNSVRSVHWIMGSAMMTSREVIDRIGLMDERIFMYFEDTDWCRRAWEAGYKVVYYPETEIYHYHGKQSAAKKWYLAIFSNRYARSHIHSAAVYFWKNRFKKAPKIS